MNGSGIEVWRGLRSERLRRRNGKIADGVLKIVIITRMTAERTMIDEDWSDKGL